MARRFAAWFVRAVRPKKIAEDAIQGLAGKVIGVLMAAVGFVIWGLVQSLPGPYIAVAAVALAVLIIWGVNGVLYMTDRRRQRATIHGASTDHVGSGPTRPRVSEAELQGNYIRGRTVRLVDVPTQGDVIRDKTFEDCDLEGPAVLVPLGQIIWQSMTFHGSLDAILWERPAGPVLGGLALERCTFLRCHTWRLGLLATPADIESFRRETREVHG